VSKQQWPRRKSLEIKVALFAIDHVKSVYCDALCSACGIVCDSRVSSERMSTLGVYVQSSVCSAVCAVCAWSSSIVVERRHTLCVQSSVCSAVQGVQCACGPRVSSERVSAPETAVQGISSRSCCSPVGRRGTAGRARSSSCACERERV
jgi:hypothetical protein